MINSRSTKDLHPRVKALAEAFLAKCAEAGINIIITSTYRDIESQNALYAQGRTAPGQIATNARGGQSFHNYRVAFDFCPLINGKAAWSDTTQFTKCGMVGESVGLEWAGRWTTFRELAHLQFTSGLTIRDFQGGKELPNA